MLSPPFPDVRIFLLGRFEVVRGERVLRAGDWTRRKAQTLLARLALEPSRRLLKDQALDLLWPDQPSAAASNNLYRTLHALRQTLDTHLGAGSGEAIFSFEDGVLMLAESVWIDVAEFERLCSSLPLPTSNLQSRISNLQSALSLYQDDLLPDDLYAEWTIAPRESLRRLHREASLAVAKHHIVERDYTAAIELLTPLLNRDRADEPVHRELMRAYTLADRRHEALRQYQACVDALAAELDVPPEPATTTLHEQILSGALAPPPAPGPQPRWLAPAPVALEVQRRTSLVGRDYELDTLQGWLHAAWRGQGRAILVAGDSGIGKTRLASEALRACASAGMTALFGAAYEQEGQLAYQPFIEAFDRYLADVQRPATENPITHFTRSGASDPQQDSWALFNAVAVFLKSLARNTPVALLVDDLHTADEASLRLFHFLARQTRATPIVLLATCRMDSPASGTPFGLLLNALYRERLGEVLTLMPLTKDAVAHLLSELLEGDVAPELISSVYDTTEGNPFFVQEIVQALLKAHQVEVRDGRWQLTGTEPHMPAGLIELLRERVARLGSPVETALIAAAAIGREFGFDILRGVAGLPDATLLDALDTALAGRLLEEIESGYRFQHPLIRRALYDSLNRTRRARLHSLAAETIESVYARRPGGLDPHVEDLAFHYDLSDRRERALDYLIRAGQKAAGVYYAFEVAVGYFERALSLMDVSGVVDPARRWMILESLGWWHTILADTLRAVARFEQAIALPPIEGWRSARRDRVRLHRGSVVALITAGDTVSAEAHLRAALAEIDEKEDASEYAHLLYNVAQFHWHRGEYREAFDAAQKSLGVAERLSETVAIARAFEMLALACHSLGEWQIGIQYEQQRASLAGPGLDVTDAFDVHL
ncbi:MAG: ATP-binding protein [Anaerolineae bacterium]